MMAAASYGCIREENQRNNSDVMFLKQVARTVREDYQANSDADHAAASAVAGNTAAWGGSLGFYLTPFGALAAGISYGLGEAALVALGVMAAPVGAFGVMVAILACSWDSISCFV